MVLGLRLAIIAWLSHSLAKEGFATFIYLYNTALVVALLSDFGMRSSLFVEIGRTGNLSRERGRQLATLRSIFGALSFTVMVVWVLSYFSGGGLTPLELVSAAMFGLFAANTPAADLGLHVMRGMGGAAREALTKSTEFLAVALLVVVSVVFSMPAELVITAWVIAGAARALWVRRIVLLPHLGPGIKTDLLGGLALVRGQTRQWLLILTNTLSMRFTILISPLLLDSGDIVFLSLSLMLVQLAQVVSSSLAFQFFGLAGGQNSDSHARHGYRMIVVEAALGLAMAAGFWVLSDVAGQLLNIDFSGRPWATLLVAVSFPLALLNDHMRFVIVYLDRAALFNRVVTALVAFATCALLCLDRVTTGATLELVLSAYLFAQTVQLIFGLGVLQASLRD